jgi:uncharacterized protein (TIGR03546 family)
MLATTLGGILGFVPGFFLPGDLGGGFLQAPGLIVLLLCCVLVLNANLGVFGLVTLGCKALSVVMLPVSYALGTWLLDGPLQGLFRALINGKVTAWCGFQYYATAGGLVFGLVFGLGSGLLFNRTIGAIRTKMASVEESSELYQKYAQKKWVRFCTWLLLGKGKGKKDWKDLSEQGKVGMPVRIWGVATAVVLVGSLWVFQQWFSTPILTSNTRGALEWMNGATVDLAAAKLDFGEGTLRFSGLAIADSKALDTDLFAADELTATLDTGELLRKRLVIDELRSTSARSGSPRSKKGVILPTKPPPPEPPPPPANTKTIEDYLADFQVWKQRLEQAREWIDVIAGGDEQPPAGQTPEQRKEDRAEQARVHGIASVVRDAPDRGGAARVDPQDRHRRHRLHAERQARQARPARAKPLGHSVTRPRRALAVAEVDGLDDAGTVGQVEGEPGARLRVRVPPARRRQRVQEPAHGRLAAVARRHARPPLQGLVELGEGGHDRRLAAAGRAQGHDVRIGRRQGDEGRFAALADRSARPRDESLRRARRQGAAGRAARRRPEGTRELRAGTGRQAARQPEQQPARGCAGRDRPEQESGTDRRPTPRRRPRTKRRSSRTKPRRRPTRRRRGSRTKPRRRRPKKPRRCCRGA